MLVDGKKYIGFYCPECGQGNSLQVGLFDFSGRSNILLVCGCGATCGGIRTTRTVFRLLALCAICGGQHRFELSRQAFWGKKTLAFHCVAGELAILHLSSSDAEIARHLQSREKILAVWLENLQDDPKTDSFMNEDIVLHTMDKLYDFTAEGRVLCKCGKCSLSLYARCHSVEIVCANCARGKQIPAATVNDLLALLACETIDLDEQASSDHTPNVPGKGV